MHVCTYSIFTIRHLRFRFEILNREKGKTITSISLSLRSDLIHRRIQLNIYNNDTTKKIVSQCANYLNSVFWSVHDRFYKYIIVFKKKLNFF